MKTGTIIAIVLGVVLVVVLLITLIWWIGRSRKAKNPVVADQSQACRLTLQHNAPLTQKQFAMRNNDQSAESYASYLDTWKNQDFIRDCLSKFPKLEKSIRK